MKSIQLIKLLRKNERSQAWLSRQLNVSEMTISKWCNETLIITKDRERQIRRLLK